MKLQQLRLEYNAENDRLLLRVATDDGKEILLWLTRRCVRLLWTLLVEMAQASPKIALQSDPLARAALLAFEHEEIVQGTDFSLPYDEAGRERPFGSEPLLVVRMNRSELADGLHMLSLAPTAGQQIDLTLDDRLLHAFCGLLRKVVGSADWELDLSLPAGLLPGEESAVRTLN